MDLSRCASPHQDEDAIKMSYNDNNDSDNVVDLNEFRLKQEKKEKQELIDKAKSAEEEAFKELSYLEDLLEQVVTDMSDRFMEEDQSVYRRDFSFSEAGYNEDGYYERSWQYDPWSDSLEEDDEDF